ncbi:hypothetical protein BJ138DRAFT_1002969, partial [Hygrophoropsis aurantiaca]
MASSSTVLAAPQIESSHSSSPAFVNSQRQSLVSSSGASFITARTAPLTAGSHNSMSGSSRSSSTQTLGPNPNANYDTENVNPLHSLGRQVVPNIHSQEVHIVKVTGDRVHLEAGPVPDSLFQKVGKSVMHVVPNECVPDR